MDTGTYISGAGHGLMIGWILLGGVLFQDRDDAPVEFTQVTMVTEAELDAMTSTAPVPVDVPDAPEQPTPVETPAQTPAPDTSPAAVPPEAVAPPPPETAPQAPPVQAPPPVAVLPDTPPEPIAPPVEAAPDAPVTVDQPPRPRPAPRVADTPQPPAPPEAVEDDTRQAATTPEPSPDPVEEAVEETAPAEAAPEIVTEAEVASAAPKSTQRPVRRPSRPVPTPAVAETPAEPADPMADAIAAAVAAAAGGQEASSPATSAPVGPPLTGGEKDALRVSVQRCWNVGSLSTEALLVTVTVGVEMLEDGKPVSGSIRMLDFTGGSQAAAKQAYEAARRAIIRCGARGFDLPVEKYSHWREIEMVFNPEKMRIK